jgi:tRNA (cmo5U34)-methyltransferase
MAVSPTRPARSPERLTTQAAGEQRFAGKLADDYALWHLARPFLGEVHDAVSAELATFVRNKDQRLRALDIGMGDGAITKLLLAADRLDVTGIDNEPKMITQARRNLSGGREAARLTILQADALEFLAGQSADAFDVIASGYAYHNFEADYRHRLYGEIWRVLAPGGLLINADKYAQDGQAHRDALHWQVGRFFDVFGAAQKYDTLREWVLHYVEDEAADRVMQEADAIACLQRLGFENVRIVYRKYMDAVLVAQKPADGWGV